MRGPFSPFGKTPLPNLRALAARLGGRSSVPSLVLTCYGKADCSLCDKAKVPISRLIASSGGRIEAEWIDILSDPVLVARWGERIPVICAGPVVLAEGKVSEVWLRRAIAALPPQGMGRDA